MVVFPAPMYDGGLCSTSSAEALSFEGEVALHPGVPRQGTDRALYIIRLLRFAIRTSMFSAHANGQMFFSMSWMLGSVTTTSSLHLDTFFS